MMPMSLKGSDHKTLRTEVSQLGNGTILSPKRGKRRLVAVALIVVLVLVSSAFALSYEIDIENLVKGVVPVWRYRTDGWVNAVAISSDGRYIAAGSWEIGSIPQEVGKVFLFTQESEKPLWSHTTSGGVESLVLSSDGRYIVAADWNSYVSRVYLFDRESPTPLWTYETDGGVFYSSSLAISSDGAYAAAGINYGSQFFVFGRDSSTPIWSHDMGGDNYDVRVAVSPDGMYVAAASKRVSLFRRDTGQLLWSYETEYRVDSISFSLDGRYLVAGGRIGTVFVLDRDSGSLFWSYETGEPSTIGVGSGSSVSISSDGRYVLTGNLRDPYGHEGDEVFLLSIDAKALLWSYKTGNRPGDLDTYSSAISSDSNYVVVGGRDGRVHLLSRESGTPLWTYRTSGEVVSVSISSDGRHAVFGDTDGWLCLLNREMTSSPLFSFVIPIAGLVILATVSLLFARKLRSRNRAPGVHRISAWKQCQECRAKLPRDAAFCDACGARQPRELAP